MRLTCQRVPTRQMRNIKVLGFKVYYPWYRLHIKYSDARSGYIQSLPYDALATGGTSVQCGIPEIFTVVVVSLNQMGRTKLDFNRGQSMLGFKREARSYTNCQFRLTPHVSRALVSDIAIEYATESPRGGLLIGVIRFTPRGLIVFIQSFFYCFL